MRALLVLAAIALSGCNALPWIAAHKLELGYVALAAGTVQAVGGAVVQADEVEQRLERRLKGSPDAKP